MLNKIDFFNFMIFLKYFMYVCDFKFKLQSLLYISDHAFIEVGL